MICERRDDRGGTKGCREIYINKINMLMSEPCVAPKAQSCLWKGKFEVLIYNADLEDLEFDWTVKGVVITDDPAFPQLPSASTPEGHNESEVMVFVHSQFDAEIEVTCSINKIGSNSPNETDTLTMKFETRHEA